MEDKKEHARMEAESTQDINKVSIKIPPFWTDKPEIWFYQVEAQFNINAITSEETKFNYLIAQLEPKYIENDWDIMTLDSKFKYTESKTRLLNIFKDSESVRIISGIELGNMKPSKLLQKLISLATSDISSNLIKTLWLEKLPDSMRNILLVSDEDVTKLASMADKIMDMTFSPDVCGASSLQTSHNVMENLLEKISSLEKQTAVEQAAVSTPDNLIDCRKYRLFIKDKISGSQFLIDSGADVSIFPIAHPRCQKSDYKLYAANGSESETYGIKYLTLDLGLRREFQWPFVIAKVNKGIIGADFLNKFNLLIDINRKRQLNARTVIDRYPIARIEDFHHILKDTKIFSKIDLLKAYFQIPIEEKDKCKTAIITPFGFYEYNVMNFGLKNALSTFQRFIHEVLWGLEFINKYRLRINVSKSVFGVPELEFLGYLITGDGSKPLPNKVQALLKNAAQTQAILHEYLEGAKKKDRSKIQWTDEARKQFEKCKQDLLNATLLSFPNSMPHLSLSTDASDSAVGGVIQQKENGIWKPVAFFSKNLNNAQKNYSTYDRELLGIYLSIKNFKYLLEGREFVIFTDHRPLIFAFLQKPEKAAPRQIRQLQFISQFSTDIRHVKGQNNIVADALSRIGELSLINYDKIAEAQKHDEELDHL
ncbi:hypothetical protein LAZ67_3004513 [Cordylochernes scorpioides]|uniref:Reverse transcriptase n=1 Tax=Cordylochernes scorpioides TaxID=51811 RepID=A0ABY6K9R1_9ARAC|nr:hypothetical protein LAZ67_3004513 [Cordylochernes scorpioides]